MRLGNRTYRLWAATDTNKYRPAGAKAYGWNVFLYTCRPYGAKDEERNTSVKRHLNLTVLHQACYNSKVIINLAQAERLSKTKLSQTSLSTEI